nr:MAG: VP1 [Canine parvovirus]
MSQAGKTKKAFRNKNKPDLPKDNNHKNLEKILGHKVGVKFAEWYRQDTATGKGMTIPFMKYAGPGNSTNIGKPVNTSDSFARKHDLQYAYASYKYQKGSLTREEFESKIRNADKEFLASNGANMVASMDPREQIASIISAAGIGTKFGAESVIPQQYPDTDPTKTFVDHTSKKMLANKLMDTLKKRVSSSVDSKQNSSMGLEGEPPLKRPATDDAVATGSSSGTANTPSDGQGTPMSVDMPVTGSGKEQASGGASSDGQIAHYIPRPLTIFGKKASVYTKVHKFMTFGFADTIITFGTKGGRCLASYLAEIPWHIPALYMNQSEFDLLPEGTRCTGIEIEVVYRGSTIQFETAASTTGLATLNQINDIGVATGLNRTGWGSNVSYTDFNTTQPMLPTGIDKPKYAAVTGKYRGMVRDYYGSDNNTAGDLYSSDIPKHQTGRQTFLYNYWGMTGRGPTDPVDATNDMYGGWPCLAEKVQQMDGKTVVNQVVLQSSYKPKLAPLKVTMNSANHGLPWPGKNAGIGVPIGGNLSGQRQLSAQIPNTDPVKTGMEVGVGADTIVLPVAASPAFTIYSPIEKCQMGRSGFWGEADVHIQPSLHIGVQPVPALSSAALLAEDAAFNAWTDTRAYWEIVARMHVEEHQPTAWPYAYSPNVPLGENVLWNPEANRPLAIKDATLDGATFAGLYTNSSMFA